MVFTRQAKVSTCCTQTTKKYLSKHLSRKLSRTLSRKIKESLSQASQRFAATTLRAETLQLVQRTSFCHGSHSCAWGGQEMNQFPGLVAEDGCSEPSVSRGISKRHAFTHPWAGWVGENKISATASRVTRKFNTCYAVQQPTQQNCLRNCQAWNEC